MSELMIRLYVSLTLPRDDRGDVPGWVMITVMSVGLVAMITVVAKDELRDLLRSALNKVG